MTGLVPDRGQAGLGGAVALPSRLLSLFSWARLPRRGTANLIAQTDRRCGGSRDKQLKWAPRPGDRTDHG